MATAADFSSRHSIEVTAPADRCYRCIRRVDVAATPLVKALLWARGLRRLTTLDAAIDSGFVVVRDEPPLHLTLGFVGKPWRPSGQLKRVSGPEVTSFAEPGFVKVLWHFECRDVAAGCVVTTSTEVFATDPAAAASFRRYWRFVGPFSGLLRRSMLRAIRSCAESATPG